MASELMGMETWGSRRHNNNNNHSHRRRRRKGGERGLVPLCVHESRGEEGKWEPISAGRMLPLPLDLLRSTNLPSSAITTRYYCHHYDEQEEKGYWALLPGDF